MSAEPCAAAQPASPTTGTCRAARFENLIRQDRPQDPKRWALIRGTQTVIWGFSALCGAAAYQVVRSSDIKQGVGVVLVSLAALLVGGTVVAHHKPDDLLPGGDQ
jgi:hypothetical protein